MMIIFHFMNYFVTLADERYDKILIRLLIKVSMGTRACTWDELRT